MSVTWLETGKADPAEELAALVSNTGECRLRPEASDLARRVLGRAAIKEHAPLRADRR